MRRIGRWMRNALTSLSMVLCIAAVGMWVRSYSVHEGLEFAPAPRVAFIADSVNGLLEFGGTRQVMEVSEYWQSAGEHTWLSHFHNSRSGGYLPPWPRWGVLRQEHCFCMGTLGGTYEYVQYTVAYPWFVAFAVPLPLFRALRARRMYQLRRAGNCMVCFYDLTGNVSGVCPECGTKIAEAK